MKIYTIKNLLEADQILELKNLIIKEIDEALDTQSPKYQSLTPQQVKHPDCFPLQQVCKTIAETASMLTKEHMYVKNCWFVIVKEDSEFLFHSHSPEKMSAVYYVENCKDNGTIFEFYYTKLQVLSEDNTAIIFPADSMHSTPSWKGKDRYCIAFDLDTLTCDCVIGNSERPTEAVGH